MRLSVSLPLSTALLIPAASYSQVDPGIHKACLDARDYIGCVEKNQISFKEAQKPIGKSLDMLNKPIIANWIAYKSPYGQSITYINPETVKKVKVRSTFGRYFEFTYLKRDKVPSVPATQGYFGEIKPGRTTCRRKSSAEVCTTYPAERNWIPGTEFIPESVKEVTGYGIVDCKDETARWSIDNKRWRKADLYYLRAAINEFCVKVGSLKKSKNMKYSRGRPSIDDLKYIKSL